ncbi:MAG: HAD family hydrolase [Vicinamibacterales bacterium]
MSSSTEPGAGGALLLFDIDGTLLLSGGAGGRAMTRAFHDVFGHDQAFNGVHMAGRTDRFLISGALARTGLPDTDEQHRRFYEAYLPLLAEEIEQPPTGRYALLPGVAALLEHLAGRADVHLALLTGNHETAARIKLAHFGIASYFPWGVFGDESPVREDLGRLALRRAAERGLPTSRLAVIGDTPQDVETARAAGARAVAVATGTFPAAALTAAGADVVLEDLGDTARVLDLLV